MGLCGNQRWLVILRQVTAWIPCCSLCIPFAPTEPRNRVISDLLEHMLNILCPQDGQISLLARLALVPTLQMEDRVPD